MLLLTSLKNRFPAAALALVGLVSGLAAHAEIRHADAYEALTAVQLAPGHAPRTVNGVAELAGREQRHHEALPMQLSQPMAKIKKAKYEPKGL